MGTPKIMKEVVPGILECKICGRMAEVQPSPDGRYPRGSFQKCHNKCKLPKPTNLHIQLTSGDQLAIRNLKKLAFTNWEKYSDLDGYRKLLKKMEA